MAKTVFWATVFEEVTVLVVATVFAAMMVFAAATVFRAAVFAARTVFAAIMERSSWPTCVPCSSSNHHHVSLFRVLAADIAMGNISHICVNNIVADPNSVNLPEEHETERIKAAGCRVEIGRVAGDLAVSRALGDFQYKLFPNVGIDSRIFGQLVLRAVPSVAPDE